MKVTIHRSGTGEKIGEVPRFDLQRYAYARGTSDGHVRAAEILSDEDLVNLGLSGAERVYAMTCRSEKVAAVEG